MTSPLVVLERQQSVWIVRMCAHENLINTPMLDALEAALDEIERDTSDAAFVITGEGKYYSTGFDPAALAAPDVAADIVDRATRLCARLLSFPVPSCAAINGHAFGIGGMIGLSQDFRVMRADRGYLCFPELALGYPLHPGMYALLSHRIPLATLSEMLLAGVRVGGSRASTERVVDEATAEADVLPRAIERAHALVGADWRLYAEYKRHLHRVPLAAIEGETSFRFPPIARR
ncbi:MAG: enoyl-CoA hydratase/isomerase family protein [Polyangiaceae bacterium]